MKMYGLIFNENFYDHFKLINIVKCLIDFGDDTNILVTELTTLVTDTKYLASQYEPISPTLLHGGGARVLPVYKKGHVLMICKFINNDSTSNVYKEVIFVKFTNR